MTRPRLCPPRPRVVFAGGRAPACWKQQVRPSAAAPAALARLCGWMAAMAQETGPKLRPKPLLGTCLAEMVGDGPAETPVAAETTASGGGKPRPTEPGAGRQAQTATPPLAHETGKRRPATAPPPLGSPRQGLIRRWTRCSPVKLLVLSAIYVLTPLLGSQIPRDTSNTIVILRLGGN